MLSNKMDNDWKVCFVLASFCGCFDEPLLCIGAFCSPPGLFGQNAKKIDGSSCLGMCAAFCLLQSLNLSWILHMYTRKRLREKYGLKEKPCHDCLVTAFCVGCAINQEARELKIRATSTTTAPISQQPVSNESLSEIELDIKKEKLVDA